MSTRGSSASKKLGNVEQFPPPVAPASRQFRPVKPAMELGCGYFSSQSFSPAKAGLASEILGNKIGAEVEEFIPDFVKLAEKLEETVIFPKEAQAQKPKLHSRRSTKNTVELKAEKKGKLPIVFKDEHKGRQLASKDGKRKKTLLKKIENVKPIGIRGSSSNTARVAGENGERNMKEKQKDISNFLKLPNFSLQLTPEEIALDMLVMTGKMPSRKPKKREKNVQRDLDLTSPGGNLERITMQRYKVSENTRKRK